MPKRKKRASPTRKRADRHEHHQLHRIELALAKIHRMELKIMSKISDFATAQNAFNDQIVAAVAGLTGDVAELNRQIKALQDSQGEITPEDQALLDGIQARSKTISDKLTALDALTPPVPPTA